MYCNYIIKLFGGVCQVDNEQLAELIQEGGNDELLPLLWDKTKALIFKKCGTIWRFYSEKLTLHGYSLEDLQQESYSALVFAVGQYKGTKGYKFTTYLNYALKCVLRGLLSGADVLNQAGTESLDKPLGESSDGDPLLVSDIVPDESAAAVFENIERLDEYKALYEAVDDLPPELKDVIRAYYFEGLTYRQIGERYGYDLEHARRLNVTALKTLRKNSKLQRLYREEYSFHNTVRHKGLSAFLSSGTSELEDYVMRQWGNYSPPE